MRLSALCFGFLSFMIAIVPLSAETPKITEKQAKAIALKLHPGKIKSSELEKEHGIQLYSFDIETKEGIREVGIDANSGKVVEDSIESAADEAKESDAKEKAAEKLKKN
jgi:peptidase YpeB-like protein